MLVARGRGAAHAVRKDDGSARSFTTAGALREVVPPPYRLGVSNPDPCRLFADRGARLAVVFIRLELCKRLWNVRASAGSVGARHE